MSGYSYSCGQCRNATVTVSNKSGLPGHIRSRSCLCYSLLSVSRGLSMLAVVNMYFVPLNRLFPTCAAWYSLVTRLSLRVNEKSFLYCKVRNAGRGLGTRVTFFLPKNNFHICALYRENEQTKSLRGEKVETK